MWKQLFELFRGTLLLMRDVADLRRELSQLPKEVTDMQQALNRVAHDFEHLEKRERLEREKHLLQLENAILRIERRLPPPKPPKQRQ